MTSDPFKNPAGCFSEAEIAADFRAILQGIEKRERKRVGCWK